MFLTKTIHIIWVFKDCHTFFIEKATYYLGFLRFSYVFTKNHTYYLGFLRFSYFLIENATYYLGLLGIFGVFSKNHTYYLGLLGILGFLKILAQYKRRRCIVPKSSKNPKYPINLNNMYGFC